MFRRRTQSVKEKAFGASQLALQLAQDKRFRKRLRSAAEHGKEAWRNTRQGPGLTGAARRLAVDQDLQAELRKARSDLQQAYARLDAKRHGHRLGRITFAALASLAAVPQVRERVSALISTASRNTQRLEGIGATANGSDGSKARPRALDDLTKEELYARAQEAEIAGRSEMSKDELIAALRSRS
jgi:hypothetical protein